MIEIPENDKKRDFENEVDEACQVVVDDFTKHGRDWAEVGCTEAMYHPAPGFLTDVLCEVATRFKARGYHAHFAYNQKGTRYALVVTKYATNKDL